MSRDVSNDWLGQSLHRVRLEWGWRGAEVAASRGDILVVVDVLSFSTTAITAVANGSILYPCRSHTEAQEIQGRTGAEIAGKRPSAESQSGGFTLSPLSFTQNSLGKAVALPSPNGATCCRLGANAPYLLLGAFINAEAVGQTLTHLLSTTVLAVTVLACGERWQSPFEEGTLRFAVEDFLGAGAVFAAIAPEMTRSPEAKAAEVAFLALRASLSETLLACGSGVELVERGFANDVLHAAQENRYPISPILHDGEYFIPFSEKPVSAL